MISVFLSFHPSINHHSISPISQLHLKHLSETVPVSHVEPQSLICSCCPPAVTLGHHQPRNPSSLNNFYQLPRLCAYLRLFLLTWACLYAALFWSPPSFFFFFILTINIILIMLQTQQLPHLKPRGHKLDSSFVANPVPKLPVVLATSKPLYIKTFW